MRFLKALNKVLTSIRSSQFEASAISSEPKYKFLRKIIRAARINLCTNLNQSITFGSAPSSIQL
jgi:hypothetical protein